MIVIPMAGLSRRFSEAGYERPKYMLPVGERSMFEISVRSFERYFTEADFLFVYREVAGTDRFVRAEAARLGIRNAAFVQLDAPTGGQAETVALGLARSGVGPATPITVFNIDTIRPGFGFPTDGRTLACAGYLEVFHGSGDNWSFVAAADADPGRVARTTEKEPISDLCSTGLYHFARAEYFLDAFAASLSGGDAAKREHYVAPLYNRLIARGLEVRYVVIDRSEVIFAGVPQEYVDLCRSWGGA